MTLDFPTGRAESTRSILTTLPFVRCRSDIVSLSGSISRCIQGHGLRTGSSLVIILVADPLGESPSSTKSSSVEQRRCLYWIFWIIYQRNILPEDSRTQTYHAQQHRAETVHRESTGGLLTKGVVDQSTRVGTTYTTSRCHRQLSDSSPLAWYLYSY